jgi:hypothetical protein
MTEITEMPDRGLMSRVDLASDILAAAMTSSLAACRVARMARISVRSGSSGVRFADGFRATVRLERTSAN